MGIINHNTIIATTWNREEVERISLWIDSLNINEKNLFVFSGIQCNNEITVVLVPDGSKEGWEESDDGDRLRGQFIFEIEKANYSDGSNPWRWVEVGFGEFGQKVLKGNNKNCYSDKEYED